MQSKEVQVDPEIEERNEKPLNTDGYGYPKDIKTALPQILAVSVKNLILLAFGTSLGYASILIPAVMENGTDESLNLNTHQISWIGSINLICVPLGCAASGSITTAIGRRKAMQMVNVPFIAAWIIFYFSTSVEMLYVSLALSGIAGGLLEAPVMVYVAEITQPYLRGMLSSTSTLCVIIGVFMQFLLGIFLTWRYVALVNAIIPIIAIFLLFFIPESPHWLIQKNRDEEARKSLQWFRGWTTPEAVELELLDIHKSKKNLIAIKAKADQGFNILQSIKPYMTGSFFYAYSMVTLGFFLCHFSGMTTLQMYAIIIFDMLKVPIGNDYASLILSIAQILGALICVSLIHFVGKRPLTFFSTIGCAVCFFIVACYSYIEDKNVSSFTQQHVYNNMSNCTRDDQIDCSQENALSWIPLTFLIASAFVSHTGIRLLPWVLIGEVFSLETKAIASGLSGGTGYLLGFAANKNFFAMVESMTLAGTFLLYSIFSISGAITFYFFLPETEGYTLVEIQNHFTGVEKLPNRVSKQKGLKNYSSKSTVETIDNSQHSINDSGQGLDVTAGIDFKK